MKREAVEIFSTASPSRPVLFWSEADARRVAEQQGKGLSLLRPYGERPAGIGEKSSSACFRGSSQPPQKSVPLPESTIATWG